MPSRNAILPVLILATLIGCGANSPPLAVVDSVDIDRYMGLWYEIARYPNWFQNDGCQYTTAQYTLRDDGKVTVLNQCHDRWPDGDRQSIEGTARVVDTTTNAKLKVGFFLFFEGDYWIIDLDDEYQWALVGEPSRNYLWILSRTPTLDEAVYNDILSRLPEQGYDPNGLVLTAQPDS